MSTGSTYDDFVQRVEKQVAAEMTDPLIDGLNEDVARKIAEFGADDGLPSADVARKTAEVVNAQSLRGFARGILAKVMKAAKEGKMSCVVFPKNDLGLQWDYYGDASRMAKLENLLKKKGYQVDICFKRNQTADEDYVEVFWSETE